MATVVVFHSVLGVRAGITDTADRLRAAGHTPVVVDQYDGLTFDTYEPAMAHMKAIGFPALMSAAVSASEVDGPFFAVGFSNGAGMAQFVASQRPDDVRGLVLVGGALPMRFLEAQWPPGVPVQVHATADDPFDDGPEVAAEFRSDVERAGGVVEAFTYPGSGHLFNDPELPDEFQPAEAEEFYARLLEFIAR